MKYAVVLLLGMVLGAWLFRQADRMGRPDEDAVAFSRAPAPGEAPTTSPAPEAPAVAAPVRRGQVPAIASAVPAAPVRDDGPRDLSIPVQGKTAADLVDTFADARSQGRSHDAIDIMAAAGTPVLAVADGHVEKLFDSERGGLTVYQFEPGGRYAFYYAHLQRYADGLAEAQPVRRGQVLGYVGSTGNASAEAPHLHFAIFVLGPERRWWEGTAINPYPALTGTPSDAR